MAMRFIKITTPSYITPLGMYGPIYTPINVAENVALRCVTAGYKTFEVDIEKGIQLPLDVINFYNSNRWDSDKVTTLNGKPVVKKVVKVEKTPEVVEEPKIEPVPTVTEPVKAEEPIIEEPVVTEPTVDIDVNTEENVDNENLNRKNKKSKRK